MYASNKLETEFLNTMRGITLAAPARVYLTLLLTAPTEDGTGGTEVAYTGYERQEITFSEPAQKVSGELLQVSISNSAQVNFAVSDIPAGTAQYIKIYDSKNGGNMLAYGKLSEELEIAPGEAPVLTIGEITYSLSGNLSVSYKAKLLNVFRGQSITGFIAHCALFNGDPDKGGSELGGGNYARVQLGFSTPTEQESGQMLIENSVATAFNRPDASWGIWSYGCIYDSLTAGEPVWVQAKPAKEIKKGYLPKIAMGDIKVAIN